MKRETIVPSIPDITGDNIAEVLSAIKTTIEVREGLVGDPLDQAVTLRELVALNLAEDIGLSTTVTSARNLPVTSALPPISDGYNPETDFTSPPIPTGLTASATFNNVNLSWDGAPYRNHGYTEIWRGTTNVLGNAVRVGTTVASVYADAATPGNTYYYWIRFVSQAGVSGPYNSSNGTVATTPQSVSYMLGVLAGQITETQLYSTLGNRINLIDNPQTGLVKKVTDLETTYGSTSSAAASSAIAVQAASDAIAAKTAALIAEGNAAGSAASASSSATLAVNSANAAGLHATAAATSASNASTYATDSGVAATASQNSATNAATSASNASTSAFNASVSETNAAGSASSAATSATVSANSANSAGLSATAAATSAQAAATKATEAGVSATAAQTSAVTASTNASNAGVYAANAATSATDASGYASSAATSFQQVQATIRGTSLGLPLEQWTLNGQSIVTIGDGKVGSKALRLSGIGGAYPNQGNYVAIDPSRKYQVRFWARPSSNAAGLLYFSLRQFINDSGSPGPTNGGRSPYKPSGQSRAAHIAAYGDTWGEYSYVWQPSDWQSGVKFVQPEFLDNYSGGAGYWDIQGFTFTDLTETVAVQTQATATANTVTGLSAQYTVKLDVNGHVSGFGLASTSVDGTPTSAFIVRADRFAVVGANDTTNPLGTINPTKLPFIVTTTPTTISGKTYPPGTWIDTAFIADATIETAMIRTLNADKITTGSLTATVGISTGKIYGGVNLDYSFGSANFGTGFFLGVDQSTYKFRIGSYDKNLTWDGTDLTVKGKIYATEGTLRGITIYDNNDNVLLSSGSPLSVSVGNVSGLGAFATLNSITSANIGTYISSAAISSAYIADASIGSAKIAGTIQSDNWSSTAGWQINKAGTATFNQVTVRGTVEVGSSPAVSGGTMTGSGAVINSSGTFAMGNSTKNISFNGTTLTVNGELVVTGNVSPGAISSAATASTAGASTSVTVSVPSGAVAVQIQAYVGLNYTGGSAKDPITYFVNGTISVNGSAVATGSGSINYTVITPASGSMTVSVGRDQTPGTMTLFVQVIKR